LLLCYNNFNYFCGGVTLSYLALYRKYRPTSFDEVFGQKYVVNIVKNAIINNKIFHAYLFSGPRGTGKTTMAKIIAKTVNCSSLNGVVCCDVCDSCSLFNDKNNPDIIEIDAASNNGVDEIRAIRDKVSLLPSVSKYKVYIIDEVHMLSISAFNALLKTLEEPPEHVIFILATTELYKVPETIVSRCQCYDFERLNSVDIVDCLSGIVEKENLNVAPEVLKLIADYSNGGMRDSIGLLDKLCSCSSVVDTSVFYDVVGLVSDDIIGRIIDDIVNKDCVKVLNELEILEKSGKNLGSFLEQCMIFLKNLIVNNESLYDVSVILKILDGFNDISVNIKFSSNILLSLEVGILKIINSLDGDIVPVSVKEEIVDNSSVLPFAHDDGGISDVVLSDNSVDSAVSVSLNDGNVMSEAVQKSVSVDFKGVINNAFALANKDLKMDVVNKWNGFYDYVHNKEFSSIVSYFLDSSVQVVGEKDVIISAEYDSVVENAVKNIAKLELLFNLVMGKFYNIAFILDSEWEVYREKYISDIKNGKKYEYVEHFSEKDVIIDDSDDSLSESLVVAKEIFGNDIVEVK